MTETNINALCSVEAVFDGVDIEVTVEFSAGGGTFEHDELTAESRAKANQHPIPSITGLQSALDGKANSSHVHNISDVTGLQSALDGKSSVVEHNDLTGRDASDVHPKESITGLKISDSPEFADTQITSLSAEATYSASVWTYLVGLFTTVPKSVKEHIVKIWGELSKKGELIVDITLQSNVSEVNISTDKLGNPLNLSGDFQMILDLEYITSGGAAAERNPYIQFNGITSTVYRFANSLNSFWNPQAIANRNRNYVNHILSIRGGKLSSLGYATGWTGTTQSQATSYNLKLESTVNALQSIKIFQSADLIKSGSTIKLYRL